MISEMSPAVRKPGAVDALVLKFIINYLTSSPEETLVQIDGVPLSASTLSRLVGNGANDWLCDKIIHCYARLIGNTRCLKDKVLVENVATVNCILGLAYQWELSDEEKEYAIKKAREFAQYKMVLFPINYHNVHWFVGALDLSKQEWQILNSVSDTGPPYEESTKLLRRGLSIVLQQLTESTTDIVLPFNFKQLDVCTWPIHVASNLPWQDDKSACGVFSLKYMQLWNGCNLTKRFSQDDIPLIRIQMATELFLSDYNVKDDIKKEFHKLAFKAGIKIKTLKFYS